MAQNAAPLEKAQRASIPTLYNSSETPPPGHYPTSSMYIAVTVVGMVQTNSSKGRDLEAPSRSFQMSSKDRTAGDIFVSTLRSERECEEYIPWN